MRKLDVASSQATEEYVHGYATAEQERLLRQAEHWRDELILAGTTLAPGTHLLEVGCGVGAVLGILGAAFPGIVLAGVDIEARQLQAARAHLARLGFEADLRQADALELPFPEASFDHVWMMWFLEHLANPVNALREARRVLVPGGTLTAIEVDYNTIWASPTSRALKALFVAVAHAMEAAARSDAGTRLPEWLVSGVYVCRSRRDPACLFRGGPDPPNPLRRRSGREHIANARSNPQCVRTAAQGWIHGVACSFYYSQCGTWLGSTQGKGGALTHDAASCANQNVPK